MWDSQLVIYVLLFNYCLYSTVQSQGKLSNKLKLLFRLIIIELFLLDDDTNSTNEEFINSTKDSLPIWTNQQLIVCFVSVSLGTLLVFVTFVVPAMIIIRRTRRDKNRLDLRELRRMSDFM
jgi:hypothetical protein